MSESERFEMAKSLNLNLKTCTTEALYAAFLTVWYVHTFWYQKDKVIDSFYIQWVTGNLKTNEACYN
jgi:hypothetical protein